MNKFAASVEDYGAEHAAQFDQVKETQMLYTFCTNNERKWGDVKAVMPNLNLCTSRMLPEIQGTADEVALQKVKDALKVMLLRSGGSDVRVVIEDTSVRIDQLNGAPGPYARDFFRGLDDEQLGRLAAVLEHNPAATAESRVVSAHYVDGDLKVKMYMVAQRGSLRYPLGEFDGEWARMFVPEGEQQSMAEMQPRESAKYNARMRCAAEFGLAEGLLRRKE